MTGRARETRERAGFMDKVAPDPLQAARDRIDAIDEEMHRLLIERSGVIAELIRIKGVSAPGSAFRPDREADMMRRFVLRHQGGLPLSTVEHIWREIISTFTAMQAPFGIAAGPASDRLAMRDLIRFYFGFSVSVAEFATAEAAIDRATRSETDIAIIAADSPGRWWENLAAQLAPKIFAKLPFIEIPGRPADLPAYVVGPRLEAGGLPDICLYSVGNAPRLQAAVASFGGRVAASDGQSVLIELPVATTLADLGRETGETLRETCGVGGFFQPIRFLAERIA